MQVLPLPISDPQEDIWPRGGAIAADLLETVLANEAASSAETEGAQLVVVGARSCNRRPRSLARSLIWRVELLTSVCLGGHLSARRFAEWLKPGGLRVRFQIIRNART